MRKLFILLSLVYLTSSAFASEGGVGSGGGKGVLCESGGTTTVESLDLWEAKNVWGYPLPSSLNLDDELLRIMPIWYGSLHESPTEAPFTYRPQDFDMWKSWYQNHFQSLMRPIPTGSHLNPTDDATIILQPPPNCRIVQILVYLDQGSNSGGILMDPVYWNALDDQNKLALYFHETIYKVWRDSYPGFHNTDTIRKYVGALFSINPFPAPIAKVRQSERALSCKTIAEADDENTAHFYVTEIPGQHEIPDNKATIYFDWLGNFGKFQGRVEYSGVTRISYDRLAASNGSGYQSDSISINSIFNGFRVELRQKGTCAPNDSSCSSLYLEQKNDDGSVLSRRVSCQPVIPVR